MLSFSHWAQRRAERVTPVLHTAKKSQTYCLKLHATGRNQVPYPLPPPVQSPSNAASPHLALADSSHSHRQRCQPTWPRIPSANPPSVPATYMVYSPCQAISSQQHFGNTLALAKGCAEPDGRACAVRRHLPSLPEASRRAGTPILPPDSWRDTAVYHSHTWATGGQKNQQ